MITPYRELLSQAWTAWQGPVQLCLNEMRSASRDNISVQTSLDSGWEFWIRVRV